MSRRPYKTAHSQSKSLVVPCRALAWPSASSDSIRTTQSLAQSNLFILIEAGAQLTPSRAAPA